MLNNPNEFDWSLYDSGYTGGTKLTPNKSIKGSSSKNKCYSREPYAQKLFDIYTHKNQPIVQKDLNKGDTVPIIDIFNFNKQFIDIELLGGLSVTVDLMREKRFIQLFGYNTPEEFTYALRDREIVKEFLKSGLTAYITESHPTVKISLWQGHLKAVRNEFMDQILNPTKAYTAKVVEANRGGFFVEVQGLDAFMPGSLAAPNKIEDFQSYIGKEIVVMIEDFLKDMNSFIVSHKKYLAHIIPIKIQELDLMKKYTGTVTGCSRYGIFIEFEEFFTGLLHTSKMDEITKAAFVKFEYKAGDEIEFFISEISKDNRIILTKEDPEEKLNKINNFVINSQDKILEGTVAAVMNFGVIVNVDDLNGLIPIKEFKKNKIMTNNFIVGDIIEMMFDEFKEEKLVFKLPPKS